MRGGRGRAGTFKHKWTSVLRYGEELRSVGFTSPKSLRKTKTINVGELNLLTQQTVEKEKTPVTIDLTELGFEKLLGGGSVQKAFNIKVAKYSKSAARKIEAAGGSVTAGN